MAFTTLTSNESGADSLIDINGNFADAQNQLDAKQPLSSVLTNTTASFTTADETKLDGIEAGAEVNTIDTVSDSSEIDFTITARDLTATIKSGSIDETKLDTSVNASLDLADTSIQPGDNITELNATAYRVFYSNGTGDVTELALGADGTYLKSNGASSAPTFDTPASASTPDASVTVAGKVEQATEAQVLAETEIGETGAPLFINPKDIQAAVEAFTPAATVEKSSILQSLVFPMNQNVAADFRMSGSDNDNAYAFKKSASVFVLQVDGQMPQIRDVTAEYAASEILGVHVNGSYVYVLATASSLCKVIRYLITDVTSSPTVMTISGQAFSTTSTNIKMAIDGTTFYFTGKAGNSADLNVISKYTLSGTTLTYDSDVTCGSTSTDFNAGMAVVSGAIYGLSETDEIIVKFNSSGTEVAASGTFQSMPSVTFKDLFNWKNRLFVVQPVRPSTTSGVAAHVVVYRVYVS